MPQLVINVVLMSGASHAVEVDHNSTVTHLIHAAENSTGKLLSSVLLPNQSTLPDPKFSLTSLGLTNGDYVTAVVRDEVRVYATERAFAILTNHGKLFTWGDPAYGGNSSMVRDQLSAGVQQVFSNSGSFAAITSDVGLAPCLNSLQTTHQKSGVITWGNPEVGADSEAVQQQLHGDIQHIYSNSSAFAALMSNGSVITWGDPDMGGNSDEVKSQLAADIVHIYTNTHAFAALTVTGAVITWGCEFAGGDSSDVQEHLAAGVKCVFSSDLAFAALNENGEVIAWGDPEYGGDSSEVQHLLCVGVQQIYSNSAAFAAVTTRGEVITWGDRFKGGDSDAVEDQLSSDVQHIYSNDCSFAALKSGGEVVTWGAPSLGGNSDATQASVK